jgi:hypothetical protein
MLGAAGWAGLKIFGATFVGIRLQSAGAVYGTLAGVATVLVLLYLMARLFLTGAVLSAVCARRESGRGRDHSATRALRCGPLPGGPGWLSGSARAPRAACARRSGREHARGVRCGPRRGVSASSSTCICRRRRPGRASRRALPTGVRSRSSDVADLPAHVPTLAAALEVLTRVPVMVELKQEALRIGALERAVAGGAGRAPRTALRRVVPSGEHRVVRARATGDRARVHGHRSGRRVDAPGAARPVREPAVIWVGCVRMRSASTCVACRRRRRSAGVRTAGRSRRGRCETRRRSRPPARTPTG